MYSAATTQVWNKAVNTSASRSTRSHDAVLMAAVEELLSFQ